MIKFAMDHNMTVKTYNHESALSVLNDAVRGKSVSYDAPFYCAPDKHPEEGVSLWLSSNPEDGDDTEVSITPVMCDGKPTLSIDCHPWEDQFNNVEPDSTPADDHDQTDPTTPESLPDYAEVQDGADAIRDNLDELVLYWAEDTENGVDLFFGEANDRKADRQLCIRPYLDENGKPQVRFVCYFNYMKKDEPQQ